MATTAVEGVVAIGYRGFVSQLGADRNWTVRIGGLEVAGEFPVLTLALEWIDQMTK